MHPMLHLSSQGRRLRPASVSAVSSAHQHRNDDRDCDSLLAGSRSSLSESLPLDNPCELIILSLMKNCNLECLNACQLEEFTSESISSF